jgi:hypothetical protein
MSYRSVLKQPSQSQPAPEKSQSTSPLGVPLPAWAITATAVIFVFYVGIHYGLQVYGEYQKTKQDNKSLTAKVSGLSETNHQLEKVKADVTAQTNARVSCSSERAETEGVSIRIPPGQPGLGAKVTYYKSDGCIHLVRDGGTAMAYGITVGGQDLWIADPSRHMASVFPTGSKSEPTPWLTDRPRKLNASRVTPPVSRPAARLVDAVFSAGATAHLVAVQTPVAGCVNPHPGQFTSRWGAASGCTVPFYRRWQDGCEHYQLYNSCVGKWDPKINWVHCSRPPHH